MPVTKSAKRAMRVSARKAEKNKKISKNLEIALRVAKKEKIKKTIEKAVSLVDRAAKKKFIHKNKAARIKSQLSKLFKPASKSKPKKTLKK